MNWFSDTVFDKTARIGRFQFNAKMRKDNGLMGRFGGGWSWKLGIMAGGSCFVLDLLIMSVRVNWKKQTPQFGSEP